MIQIILAAKVVSLKTLESILLKMELYLIIVTHIHQEIADKKVIVKKHATTSFIHGSLKKWITTSPSQIKPL